MLIDFKVDREIIFFFIIGGFIQFLISIYVYRKLKKEKTLTTGNLTVQFAFHFILINFAIIAGTFFVLLLINGILNATD